MTYLPLDSNPIKVSVLVTTYNHEKFISQALNSVLMQAVDFDYEIVIAEDFSNDRTRDIIKEYQQKYPNKINLFLAEKNFNSNSFFVRSLQICQGEYISLLDGDDYWTSPYKLQKQVDFLEKNPELSICFHNVNVVYEDKNIITHLFHLKEPNYHISKSIPKFISTLEDIVVTGNFMQTCSVMFRTRLFEDIPDWYNNLPIGDWPLHIFNAEYGNIGYLDEILGTYRVHSGGVWSTNMSQESQIDNIEKMIELCETIEKYYNYKYNRNLKICPLNYYYKKAIEFFYNKQKYQEYNFYVRKYLSRFSFKEIFYSKILFKVLFKAILVAQFYRILSILKFLTNKSENK